MDTSLTTIALVWTIYIFLFSEADKHLEKFLKKVQFAISIDHETDTIDPQQLSMKQQFTAQQVFDFGECLNEKDLTRRFYKKYKNIETWKTALLANISILTIFGLTNECGHFFPWLRLHIFLTLILAGIFYYQASGLSSEKFHGFIADSHASADNGEKY